MKNKTKNIMNSLLLVFLLVGSILPAGAFTYQEKENNLVIDVQEISFFSNLFGIITTTPTVVSPGQTIAVNVGLEISRYYDLSSSYMYIVIGPYPTGGSILQREIRPIPTSCPAFSSCAIKVTFTIPSTASSGIYQASFEMGDKNGKIDRATQQFSVSTGSTACPPSTWGPYSDYQATSDGQGIIRSSTKNVYDSQCTLTNVERQYFTVCNSGYYITGQATSVSQLLGKQSCTPSPGTSQTPRCGNGVIDTGEYCDTSNVGASCTDYGFTSGTLKCASNCLDIDISQCTSDGGNLPKEKSKTLTILQLKSLLDSTDAQKAQDLPKSFCNIKEDCDSNLAQCITIGKASQTQSIADVFIPGSIENTISNVFKALYKTTTTAGEINKYNTNNAQGICLSDFNAVTCVDETCDQTIEIKLHPGIDPVEADGSTTEDLISSACTKTENCESDSTCKSLDWYVKNDYLTKDDAQQKINDARIRISGTTLGAGLGFLGGAAGAAAATGAFAVTTGGAAAGLCAVATLGTAGIAAPLCFGIIGVGALAGGIAGSQLGGYIADVVNAIGDEDTAALGYCTLKSSLPDTSSFFNKTLFDLGTFHVTGLYAILGVLGLLLLLSAMGRRN